MNRILVSCMLAVATVGLVGCFRSGPQAPRGVRLAVGNAGEQSLTEVEVEAPGLEGIRTDRLEPMDIQTSREVRQAAIPDVLRLAWRDAEGNAHRRDLALEDRPPGRFIGRVFVEFPAEGEPLVFFLVDSGRGASGIPWSAAPSWQGLPSIPGLTGD